LIISQVLSCNFGLKRASRQLQAAIIEWDEIFFYT